MDALANARVHNHSPANPRSNNPAHALPTYPSAGHPGFSAQVVLSPDERSALIIDPSRTELTIMDLSALQEPLAPPTASPTAAATQDPSAGANPLPRPTPKVAAHRFSARAPPSVAAGGQAAAAGKRKGAGGAAGGGPAGGASEPQYEAFAAACWSPDGTRVAVVCRSGNLYLLERYDGGSPGRAKGKLRAS